MLAARGANLRPEAERMTVAAREKAKALRWKRPMMRDLNWWHIVETLDEIAEAAADIQWMDEDEIAEALGDEEEAYEFRVAFSDLAGDCERFREELEQVREYEFISTDADGEDEATLFDLFFPAVDAGGEMLGYDSFEEDFFPLDPMVTDYARQEAAKRLKRLTKDQLLDAAGLCLRIAAQFVAIQYRYDCLSASLAILRGEQDGLLKMVKGSEDAYTAAEAASNGFRFDFGKEVSTLDRMLREVPERMWVE